MNAYLNDQHLPGYVFPQPITPTINYDPALLGGLVEHSLVVYYWNGISWDKDGATLVSRNTTDHTITIRLEHLSELAFFASAPTALEPGGEPGAYAAHLYLPAVHNSACQRTSLRSLCSLRSDMKFVNRKEHREHKEEAPVEVIRAIRDLHEPNGTRMDADGHR